MRVDGIYSRAAAATVALVLSFAQAASAMEAGQSPVFKGYRDFMAGVIPAPGIYVRNDIIVYAGIEHSRVPQGDLTLTLRYVADIAGGLLVTPYEVLGARYALGVRAFTADAHVDQTVQRPQPFPVAVREQSHAGPGDLVVTPFILGWQAGNLHWNVATSLRMPSGDYDAKRLVNIGRNVWTLGLQSGLTWFDKASGWDFSAAADYLVS